MKNLNKNIIVFLMLCLMSFTGFAQENQKLAQTGFQFLSVVSDARAAAMGEAMTSLQVGSSALFFNPAGMSDMTNTLDITCSTNKWIADIRHTTFSAAYKPANGQYGVIGLSAQIVNYGDFYGTRVNKLDPKGYDDTGIFTLTSFAFGLGYAKQLTEHFSVGGQIRWVRQDLGESQIAVITTDTTQATVKNKMNPFVFDFGTQFRTGIESLVFGMSIRNFSKEVKYAEEGFQAPLVFTLGISMDVMDLFKNLPFEQSLMVAVDASHYRDHAEQIKVGLDYKVMNTISVRGGYIANNDESGLSFGVGVSKFGFSFDYAYTPFGVFDNVQRFTARFTF